MPGSAAFCCFLLFMTYLGTLVGCQCPILLANYSVVIYVALSGGNGMRVACLLGLHSSEHLLALWGRRCRQVISNMQRSRIGRPTTCCCATRIG
eukprot:1044917-Amphidinium_carterae.2